MSALLIKASPLTIWSSIGSAITGISTQTAASVIAVCKQSMYTTHASSLHNLHIYTQPFPMRNWPNYEGMHTYYSLPTSTVPGMMLPRTIRSHLHMAGNPLQTVVGFVWSAGVMESRSSIRVTSFGQTLQHARSYYNK